jgi:hypothetical protein
MADFNVFDRNTWPLASNDSLMWDGVRKYTEKELVIRLSNLFSKNPEYCDDSQKMIKALDKIHGLPENTGLVDKNEKPREKIVGFYNQLLGENFFIAGKGNLFNPY